MTKMDDAKAPSGTSGGYPFMDGLLQKAVFHVLIISALGLLIYSNAAESPFVFDDKRVIVENKNITDPGGIPTLFAGREGPIASRPTMLATFALNYAVGGLDASGYHAVNIVLHILNAVLLYSLILTSARLINLADRESRLTAFFSALLWMVHPVQTESVTYIASRSILLTAFFYIVGIILFVKAARAGRRRWIYVVALAVNCLLGMGSKESFSTFPAVLVLYDYLFVSGRDMRKVARNYYAHLPGLVSLLYLAFLYFNFRSQLYSYGTLMVTPGEYFMTQFSVHMTYLRLLAFPVNLHLDYAYPVSREFFTSGTFISFLGYAGLWAAGVFALMKGRTVLSFTALWFMITLTPDSSVVPLNDMIFEHRLYLSSMGAATAVVAFTVSLSSLKAQGRRQPVRALLCGILLFAAVLSTMTYVRNIVWKNGISLWKNSVEKSPGKSRPHNNLGFLYNRAGRHNDAERELLAAVKIDESNYKAHDNLGITYLKKRRYDDALESFRNALSINPNYAVAHYNIGIVHERRGQYDNAIREYREAIRINPDYAEAHNNLGVVHQKLGQSAEAVRHYRAALKIDPETAHVHYNLGVFYGGMGQYEVAESAYLEALRIRPDYAKARNNLGIVYIAKGELEKAVWEFQLAVKFDPDNLEFGNNLKRAYDLIKKR
jgi:Flp pilus assembly protein TadD